MKDHRHIDERSLAYDQLTAKKLREIPALVDRGLANVERWRTRLLSDADALALLCAENTGADRPRLAAVVARVHEERAHSQPPHAYRELFRLLNDLMGAS